MPKTTSSALLVALAPLLGASFTRAQTVYWTDFEMEGGICRADVGTMVMERVIPGGLFMPYRMAVDPVEGKLYWTQPYSWEIMRANLDGSDLECFITLEPG